MKASQYRPPNIMILIMGTSNKVFPDVGSPKSQRPSLCWVRGSRYQTVPKAGQNSRTERAVYVSIFGCYSKSCMTLTDIVPRFHRQKVIRATLDFEYHLYQGSKYRSTCLRFWCQCSRCWNLEGSSGAAPGFLNEEVASLDGLPFALLSLVFGYTKTAVVRNMLSFILQGGILATYHFQPCP